MFYTPPVFSAPVGEGVTPSEFREVVWCWWNYNDWATYGKKNYDDMLSRFHLIPERYGRIDGRTDKQTDRQICYINIASQYADGR